jgi:hypothetical protein
MLRVYNLMATGLGVIGLVAVFTTALAQNNPAVAQVLYASPLRWLIMLAPLGFVFVLSVKVNAISATKAQTVFWTFATVMGVSLSFLSRWMVSGAARAAAAGDFCSS